MKYYKIMPIDELKGVIRRLDTYIDLLETVRDTLQANMEDAKDYPEEGQQRETE